MLIRGVTKHLSHETRHETELTLTAFFFLSSMMKYIGKIVFYSTEKHKMLKNVDVF